MAKVGKFCLAKRVKVEWLFHCILTNEFYPMAQGVENHLH